MEKENNHFIPKCYQKQWYVNHSLSCYSYDNTTSLYKKLTGERNHGNNTTSVKQLNWLDTQDEKKKVSLEDYFGTQETKISKILRDLSGKADYIHNISDKEKLELLNFVSGLIVRSPGIIGGLKTEESRKEAEDILKCNFLRNGGTLKEYYFATSHPIIQEDIKNLTMESLKGIGTGTKIFQEFLSKKFKNATIVLLNTEKSNYKLLTSNYPVIHGTNIFTKEGLIFPVSPTKIMLIVSQESKIAYDEVKKNSVDYFPIIVNTDILKNHIGRNLPFDYMVYSATDNKKEILPAESIEMFFSMDTATV